MIFFVFSPATGTAQTPPKFVCRPSWSGLAALLTVEAVLKQKEPQQSRKRRGGRQPTKPANRGARLFVGRSLCGYLPEDGDHLGEHAGPTASECGTAQKEVDVFSDGRRTWPFGGTVGSHTKKSSR